MNEYLPVDASLQAVFEASMPLMPAQTSRMARLCTALVNAGEVSLSRLGRQLKMETQQDSRIRWISRLLETLYVSQSVAYQPFIRHILASYSCSTWHLVIDRTTINGQDQDVVIISLNYAGRAIPLIWEFVPFGGAGVAQHCALIRRCAALIPSDVQVIFHGDTEFGALAIIKLLVDLNWDFMLAQKKSNHFWALDRSHSQAFATLPVCRHRTLYRSRIGIGQHGWGCFNLMAFYKPRYSGGHRRREIAYIVTSLPLSRGLKRIGRRRWGAEPFHRDYKSSGWRMTASKLRGSRLAGLFVIMALAYVWAVCIGRWLCKRGERQRVDSKPRRHLSLFRIGWDWLVHTLRMNGLSPPFLRLYP